MKIEKTWTQLKALLPNKILMRIIDKDTFYYCWYDDFEASVLKDSGADQTDLEANYLASSNGVGSLYDADGVSIVRSKAAKNGWHVQPNAIEFTTSSTTVYNKGLNLTTFADSDLGHTTVKLYDSGGTEITPGDEANTCTTVVDWMPLFDYEIVGAKLRHATAPTTDMRLWVIAVPDVTYANGGSIPFGQGGINLKHVKDGGEFNTDGRASKYMTYNATYKTNKFRLILKHAAGTSYTGMMVWEIFKAL